MTLQHYEGADDSRSVGERLRHIWGKVNPETKRQLGPQEELNATMAAIRAAADLTLNISEVTMSDLVGAQSSGTVVPKG